MMEFVYIVKTFGSKALNMIEAKPVKIDYLLDENENYPK